MYSFYFFASSPSDEPSERNVYRYSHSSKSINNANNIFYLILHKKNKIFKCIWQRKNKAASKSLSRKCDPEAPSQQ